MPSLPAGGALPAAGLKNEGKKRSEVLLLVIVHRKVTTVFADHHLGPRDQVPHALDVFDRHGVVSADQQERWRRDAMQVSPTIPVLEVTRYRELARALHGVINLSVHGQERSHRRLRPRVEAADVLRVEIGK